MEDRYAAMRQQLEAALTVIDEIQREAAALAMPTHTYLFTWENPSGGDQEGRATDISISARTPGDAWATFGTFVRDWQFQRAGDVTMSRPLQRHESRYRATVERYTPVWLMDRVAAFLGPRYFDPCPESEGQVPAVNGLEITWTGRVWVNPPYRPIAPWVTKAVSEPVDELLLLVPAYTETRWFRPLFAFPMCFIHGRLRFRRPGDLRPMELLPQAPHPTVLVYRGERLQDFSDMFEDIGPIMRVYRPQRVNGLWS